MKTQANIELAVPTTLADLNIEGQAPKAINKDSKKGDRVLVIDRLGKQSETVLLATPLFNEEGQLVGWSTK